MKYKCIGVDKLVLKLRIEDEVEYIEKSSLNDMFSGLDIECKSSGFRKFVNDCSSNIIPFFETENIRLVFKDTPTHLLRTYKDVYDVYLKNPLNDIHIGCMGFNAHNKEYYGSLIYLDIRNNILYNLSQLVRFFRLLFSELNVECNNISVIDIFNDIDKDLVKVLNRYFNNPDKYYFKKWNKKTFEKLNLSTDLRTDINVSKSGEGIYFLNKKFFNKRNDDTEKSKHTVLCRVYNKSLELTKNEKIYIDLFHKKHNLKNNIYRMEFSISNDYLYKNKLKIDLLRLDDKGYLNAIFDMMYKKFFDIRIKSGDTNVSRYKNIKNIFM